MGRRRHETGAPGVVIPWHKATLSLVSIRTISSHTSYTLCVTTCGISVGLEEMCSVMKQIM